MYGNAVICVEYMKYDIKKELMDKLNIINETDITIITNIINKRITYINMSSFSLEEYFTFEKRDDLILTTYIEYRTLKTLRKHRAFKIFNKYLKPRIIHRLYKYPNGLRFNKIKNNYELFHSKLIMHNQF